MVQFTLGPMVTGTVTPQDFGISLALSGLTPRDFADSKSSAYFGGGSLFDNVLYTKTAGKAWRLRAETHQEWLAGQQTRLGLNACYGPYGIRRAYTEDQDHQPIISFSISF